MSMPTPFAVRSIPVVALLFAAEVSAQEPVDAAAVAYFRDQGLQHSQVMDHLSWMCDVYGPRLTGSPNLRRAQDWAIATFSSWGLDAHTEPWGPFGRGWRCERALVEVVGDNPWPVLAYPKAWSPSLPGRVEAEVVQVGDLTAEQLEALDLTGKVVLTESTREVQEPWQGLGRRYEDAELDAMAGGDARAVERTASTPAAEQRAEAAPRQNDFRVGFARRQAVLRAVMKKRPLALVDRASKGDYGTVFVQGAAAMPREGDAAPGEGRGGRGERANPRAVDAVVIPQFTIAVEHYNRICRILDKGLSVRVAIELQTAFGDDGGDHNVVAEIPGHDPALCDQVVMFGGHFDSWHTGTGSTDNGCGSAVVMEAARLIAAWRKTSGREPRRTIRAALWSGEEQGLLGSRAYVRQHFGEPGAPTPEHARLAGYFNLDNGTGRIRGVYQQGNLEVAKVFAAWLLPFRDLSATALSTSDTGGTDHLAFDRVGLPGFQFIQDPISYDTRTHHSNMDVWDHAVAADLQQAATIMAAFVWHAAQRDAMLPRKAQPGREQAEGAPGNGERSGGR